MDGTLATAGAKNMADRSRTSMIYRNKLVHGRVMTEVTAIDPETMQRFFFYPRLDRVDSYLDWRTVLPDPTNAIKSGDYAAALVIAMEAWERVVEYCEQAWATHLL
jgi:hypothetical protein